MAKLGSMPGTGGVHSFAVSGSPCRYRAPCSHDTVPSRPIEDSWLTSRPSAARLRASCDVPVPGIPTTRSGRSCQTLPERATMMPRSRICVESQLVLSAAASTKESARTCLPILMVRLLVATRSLCMRLHARGSHHLIFLNFRTRSRVRTRSWLRTGELCRPTRDGGYRGMDLTCVRFCVSSKQEKMSCLG